MARESMDALELLCKRGVDGDIDFLREALRVLTNAIMDAEVSARIGAEHAEIAAVPVARHNQVPSEGHPHEQADRLSDGEASRQGRRTVAHGQLPQLPGHWHHQLPIQRREF